MTDAEPLFTDKKPETRYVAWWKRDPETGEFHPRALFEIDASGKVTPFDFTGQMEESILDREWPIANGISKDRPEHNKLVDVSEAEASVIRMELSVAHSKKRDIGDMTTGDHIVFEAEKDDFLETTGYGRVLEPLGKHYLTLILGANLESHDPFEGYSGIYETDGRSVGRKVRSASELEPGKIYAVDPYYEIPLSLAQVRHVRQEEQSQGWVHVPDDTIDQKPMKAGKAKRARNKWET